MNTVSVSLESFGRLPGGEEVMLANLRNLNGVEVEIISYGGIITRLITPDRLGRPGDIVLGLDSLEAYVGSTVYLGAIVGRYANRIAAGRFELDGERYRLDINNGPNHLHGGIEGFDRRNWTMQPFLTENSAGVTLDLDSPDGDQGYPGELSVRTTYELLDSDELDIRFRAATSRPTLVNLTQHSYFNLAGGGRVLDHQLKLNAEHFTPVDQNLVPTGAIEPVAGTPLDFRKRKRIGRDIDSDHAQISFGGGFDHNYVLKTQHDDRLLLAAQVTEPESGRVLEVLTLEPGVQFYSGNSLEPDAGGKGRKFGPHSAFCLEPQRFPDSPNQPHFPSAVLRPEEEYRGRIVYRFGTLPRTGPK